MPNVIGIYKINKTLSIHVLMQNELGGTFKFIIINVYSFLYYILMAFT